MRLPECRAYTIVHDKIVKVIESEILISDGMIQEAAKNGPEKCGARKYAAIWDTGATSSAITR
jgi:hypothetical protein